MIRKLATKIVLIIERVRGRFITFHTRPMFEAELTYEGKETPGDARCAIVIQGPIRHQDDFTFETVKIYRRHYPASTIILSTWVGEDVSKFEQFKGERFKILFGTRPEILGPHNINMQIVSTKAGMVEAFKMGFHYTMKTRTDQRMNSINTIQFMINLLNQFPVINSVNQKKRIISTTMGTSKMEPYYFSDLFMFGDSADMNNYWDTELIADRGIKSLGFLPEGYLLKHFLRKGGYNPAGTIGDFMTVLGERCIVLDNEGLDIYWPKYAAIWREYRLRNYFSPTLEISFKTWLNEAFIPTLHGSVATCKYPPQNV